MRFGTSALFQSHARGKSGAIVEPGDGELQFPPVLNLVTDVGGSISRNVIDLTNPRRQTFAASNSRTQTGANAGGANTIAVFGVGIWHISWNFAQVFTGTTNTANQINMNLTDPGGTAFSLARTLLIAGRSDVRGSFALDFADENWTLAVAIDETIAGDVAFAFGSVVANKIA